MLKLIVLIAIMAALFVFLPPMPAAFWSILPAVVLAGVLFDAVKRGRRLMARQRDKTDPVDEVSRLVAGVTIFHAVWLGLHSPDPGTMHGGAHTYGGDVGGFDGGFDGGGGGAGDAGGGGF